MVGEVPIVSIDDEFPKVDAIVVTVLSDYGTIRNELRKKCDFDIVSINDVIFGSIKVKCVVLYLVLQIFL